MGYQDLLTGVFKTPRIYIFSAQSRESLGLYCSIIARYIFERVYLNPLVMKALAFTLSERRLEFPWKVAVSATFPDELI